MFCGNTENRLFLSIFYTSAFTIQAVEKIKVVLVLNSANHEDVGVRLMISFTPWLLYTQYIIDRKVGGRSVVGLDNVRGKISYPSQESNPAFLVIQLIH